jgi:hypothetical protein
MSADALTAERLDRQQYNRIPKQISETFDRIVADLDEPFADPSSVPTWYLARETACPCLSS